MRGGRRGSAIAAVSSAVMLVAVSAFAQSDSEPRWDARVAIAGDRTGFGAVRVYNTTDAAGSAPSAAPPPNLRFSATHRPIVESMLRYSSTFRRQCLRIANAPSLTIFLRPHQTRPHERFRARTRVSRGRDGGVYAIVEIRLLDDQVELIAHELEHVIEQLDGVDLAYRASLPATGVRLTNDGAFETLRAKRVGAAVAREVRRAGG